MGESGVGGGGGGGGGRRGGGGGGGGGGSGGSGSGGGFWNQRTPYPSSTDITVGNGGRNHTTSFSSEHLARPSTFTP